MASSFSWPLSTNTFTLWDRAKIGWWLLTQTRYTMGEVFAWLGYAIEARMDVQHWRRMGYIK